MTECSGNLPKKSLCRQVEPVEPQEQTQAPEPEPEQAGDDVLEKLIDGRSDTSEQNRKQDGKSKGGQQDA